MADDSDPQLTLRASLDPSGVNTGADQTVDALGKVKDSAKDAGEGISNSLDNRRAVTHALRGLMELREGGVMAIAGLSSEAFVATEAFEGMLGPLAPFLMTLTLIGSIGIPMFARLGESGKKAAGDATDSWKDANDEFDAQMKRLGDTKYWDDSLTRAKAVTAEITAQAAAYKTIQDAQEKLLEAENKLAIARLNNREQQELEGKSGQDAEDIRSKYKLLRDEATASSEAQHAGDEIKLAQQEKEELQRKRAAQDAQLDEAARLAEKNATPYEVRTRSGLTYVDSDYEAAKKRLEDYQYRITNSGAEGVKPLGTGEVEDYQGLTTGRLENLRSLETGLVVRRNLPSKRRPSGTRRRSSRMTKRRN